MTDRLTWPRRIAVVAALIAIAAFFLPEHAGTVLCVERNEARLHGEACAEAQTQRTVPVVFGLSCLALTPVILSEVTPKPKDLISLSCCRWNRSHCVDAEA